MNDRPIRKRPGFAEIVSQPAPTFAARVQHAAEGVMRRSAQVMTAIIAASKSTSALMREVQDLNRESRELAKVAQAECRNLKTNAE